MNRILIVIFAVVFLMLLLGTVWFVMSSDSLELQQQSNVHSNDSDSQPELTTPSTVSNTGDNPKETPSAPETDGEPTVIPTTMDTSTDSQPVYRIALQSSVQDFTIKHAALQMMKRNIDGLEYAKGEAKIISSSLDSSALFYDFSIPPSARNDDLSNDVSGYFALRIIAAGHESYDISFHELIAGERISITLQAGRRIYGKVVDDISGKPLEGVKIMCRTHDNLESLDFLEDLERLDRKATSTVTDEYGHFELLSSIPTVTLRFQYPSYPIKEFRKLDLLADLQKDVRLHPGITLQGTATLPDGTPFIKGRIFFADADHSHEPDAPAAMTDDHGDYTLPGLLPGVYRVRVTRQTGRVRPSACSPAGTLTLPSSATEHRHDVKAPFLVSLSGKVYVPSSSVTQGHFVTFIEAEQRLKIDLPFNVRTGEYRLELPAGTYQIRVIKWTILRTDQGKQKKEELVFTTSLAVASNPIEQIYDIRP